MNPTGIYRGASLVLILGLLAALSDLAAADIVRSARIKSATGTVRIQREHRTSAIAARSGTELQQGDLVIPDKGVQVTVICPDATERLAKKPFGLGKVCLVWRTDIAKGSQFAAAAGGLDRTIPYLIAPRHTLLLSPTPTLRWNPVPGATQYQVEVRGPQGTLWKAQTSEPQLVYAGQPLVAGIPYSVVVNTNTGRSSQDDKTPNGSLTTALNFRLLRPADAAAVQAITAKLLAGKNPNASSVLMLATYYGDYMLPQAEIAAYGFKENASTYNLSAEAISLLEAQVKQGKTSPVMQRTLGDLYWQSGLIRLAESAYKQTIAQAKLPDDREEWTLAHYSLADIYAVLNDEAQLVQSLSQAKAGFLELGDRATANRISRQLEKRRKS